MRCQNGISKDEGTDERIDKVFQYIEDHAESEQKIFFDGQIYDAFSLITSIIQMRIQQLREEGATEDIDLALALLDYYRRHKAGGDK